MTTLQQQTQGCQDWRERATAAFRGAMAAIAGAQAAAMREQRARATRELLTRLGKLGIPADPAQIVADGSEVSVAVDGVTFSVAATEEHDHLDLCIVDICPACQRRACGPRIMTIEDLGQQLVQWEPDWTHRYQCPGWQQPEPRVDTPRCTERERALLDALAAFLQEANR